jgi:predicted GIY-YIG superfamily endonuclease
MPAHFYILRLRSGQLYTGATTDLDRRWKEHANGEACRTTKLDPPVAIAHTEEHPTFSDARRREAQIKRWSRAKREALATGDTDALKRLAKSHDHQSPRKCAGRPNGATE